MPFSAKRCNREFLRESGNGADPALNHNQGYGMIIDREGDSDTGQRLRERKRQADREKHTERQTGGKTCVPLEQVTLSTYQCSTPPKVSSLLGIISQ